MQHTFERKGAYTVTARVGIVGRFWYEELLDDVTGGTTVTLRHDVVEIRTLLHGH